MDNLVITERVRLKLLEKHAGVTRNDVEECFANLDGKFLVDTRLKHQTHPPTWWFIAENNYGRVLKVAFMLMPDGAYILKTAYDANSTEIAIYRQLAQNTKDGTQI